MAMEMLEFPNGVFGMALNLEEDSVGAVLFGENRLLRKAISSNVPARLWKSRSEMN